MIEIMFVPVIHTFVDAVNVMLRSNRIENSDLDLVGRLMLVI